VPRSGEFGNETWAGESWKNRVTSKGSGLIDCVLALC